MRQFVAAALVITSLPILAGDIVIPQIDSITPDRGPTEGLITITIEGSGFGPDSNGQVYFDSTQVPHDSWTDTMIEFQLPEGEGQAGIDVGIQTTFATVADLEDAFVYEDANISNIDPDHGPTAGGPLITIDGENFGYGGSVRIDGRPCVTNSWSHRQVTFFLPEGEGDSLNVDVQTQQGTPSASFNYDPPAISQLDPQSGPTEGGSIITLHGQDFGTTGSVTLNGNAATTNFWSHARVEFQLPPGEGRNHVVALTTGNQSDTAASRFHYDGPSVTLVNPDHGPTAGSIPITIRGTSFGTSGTVHIGGSICTNQFWDHREIRCILPEGSGRSRHIEIATASGTNVLLSGFSYDPPAITNLTPTVGPTQGGTPITIFGSNFGTSGRVLFAGQDADTNSWDHARIVFALPEGDTQDNVVRVLVDGQEDIATNLVYYYAPAVSGIQPTNAPTSGGTLLTIQGSSFGTNGFVTIGGQISTNVLWNHATIQCLLPAGVGRDLTLVIDAAHADTNLLSAFSYDAPVVTNITPDTVGTRGGGPITILGSSFGPIGSLQINGQSGEFTDWDHNRILCILPPGQGTGIPLTVSTASGISTQQFVHYSPPAITNLTPNAAPTRGGGIITIYGSNFGTSGSVRLGSGNATSTFWNHEEVRFLLPSLQGSELSPELVLEVASQTSNPTNIMYLLPHIALTVSNQHAILSWPDTATDFRLQDANSVPLLPDGWTNAPASTITNAGRISTTLQLTTNRVYRLNRN